MKTKLVNLAFLYKVTLKYGHTMEYTDPIYFC